MAPMISRFSMVWSWSIFSKNDPPVVTVSSMRRIFHCGAPTKYLSFGSPCCFGFPRPMGRMRLFGVGFFCIFAHLNWVIIPVFVGHSGMA